MNLYRATLDRTGARVRVGEQVLETSGASARTWPGAPSAPGGGRRNSPRGSQRNSHAAHRHGERAQTSHSERMGVVEALGSERSCNFSLFFFCWGFWGFLLVFLGFFFFF